MQEDHDPAGRVGEGRPQGLGVREHHPTVDAHRHADVQARGDALDEVAVRAVEEALDRSAPALLVEVAAAGAGGGGPAHGPGAQSQRQAYAGVARPGDGVVPELHGAGDGTHGAEHPVGDAPVDLADVAGPATQRQPGQLRDALDLVGAHPAPRPRPSGRPTPLYT